MNLKLEHAFYQMRERVQRLSKDQRLSCSDIRALGNTNKPDNSLHAQYLSSLGVNPALQLLPSPPEMVLAQLEEDWDPESASRGGAYQTEALLRWSEFYQTQY